MILYPNELSSLIWGLQNFDGIETDLRVNADNEMPIFHNTQHNKKLIRDMTSAECRRFERNDNCLYVLVYGS